jgi:hypothetical protein
VGVRQQKQQQEQEPPQTESIQPPVTCVLVPTAALLAEMLPLLTKHCLTALKGLQHEQQQHQYQYQQQQQQQHQQQQGSASQQAGGGSAPASTSGTAAVELSDYSNPSKPTYMGHTRMSLFACVDSLAILLSDLVVPEQTGAAPTTEVPMAEASVPTLAAAAAASSDSAPAVPEASYSYVLHAQETIMPHVVDTLRVLEGLLRETAAGSVSLAGLLPKVAAGLSALCSYYIKEDGPNNRSSTLVTLALAAGPGSRAQRQLYSLLCTLLQIIPALPHKSKHVAQQLCEIASGAAEALLDGAAWQQQQQQRHAGDSATAAAASDPHPAAAVAMLPSLFIVGRSILYIAGGLQGAIPGLTQQQHPGSSAQEQPQPGSSAQEQPQPGSSARQQPQPGSSAQEQPQPGSSAQEQQKPGSGSSAQEQQQPAAGSSAKAQNTTWSITLGPLLKWLQAGSTSEQLAAAGYTLQSVLQHLGQMPESSEAVFTNKNSRQPNEAALLAAVQQYRATGLALCSFAVSCVCNNPGCFNLSGPSALHLVSGRSCLCGGCRTARFCSHACLRACWKHHKPVCEALAAAAAATAAAASSAAAP